ncbi:MAG: class I SAM-dependent methyltransferase [Actinobacteria bacterium]|nr:class I SAM-dependent methyltransferase [Actinomycetota bacterium]
MSIQIDPEANETNALFDLLDLDAREVLVIGCGDGGLTWQYADRAAHVTVIDTFAEVIGRAKERLPGTLKGRVEFYLAAFEEFARSHHPSAFDVVILAWSLC